MKLGTRSRFVFFLYIPCLPFMSSGNQSFAWRHCIFVFLHWIGSPPIARLLLVRCIISVSQ